MAGVGGLVLKASTTALLRAEAGRLRLAPLQAGRWVVFFTAFGLGLGLEGASTTALLPAVAGRLRLVPPMLPARWVAFFATCLGIGWERASTTAWNVASCDDVATAWNHTAAVGRIWSLARW